MENNTNEVVEKAEQIIEKEEKIGLGKKIVNGVKSGAKKVKTTMSEHPVATLVTGTVIGSAGTVLAAVGLNKLLNKDKVDDLDETDVSDDDLESINNDVDDINNVDI